MGHQASVTHAEERLARSCDHRVSFLFDDLAAASATCSCGSCTCVIFVPCTMSSFRYARWLLVVAGSAAVPGDYHRIRLLPPSGSTHAFRRLCSLIQHSYLERQRILHKPSTGMARAEKRRTACRRTQL